MGRFTLVLLSPCFRVLFPLPSKNYSNERNLILTMPNPFGRRRFLQRSVNLLALTGLSLVACGSTNNSSSSSKLQTKPASKTMQLKSNAFSPEEMIPSKYSCDGEDVSPRLSWGEIPNGTQSLALIADDPDAPGGTFVHWVLYNLPPDTHQLPENVPAKTEQVSGALQGKNNFGNLGYGGPCPPGGTHRYFFKLYALDQMLDLKAGATKAEVEAAMEGHVLAEAHLMGRYSRQS